MKVTSFITLSLLLMLALGVSIHACFSDENYYVFLQLWYFNSANVHQSYLGLDLLATQDNAANMSMYGEFDLYGTNQYLRFWIDSSPMSNETQWTGLTIQVKGTFLDINGSREYSSIYNNTIVVKPESIRGINRIEYFFNFSNKIQEVKEQVYPEQSLENIGIYGSVALDITIHEIVGQVGTQNYIKLALHADSESPYAWVLLPSIRIPETAQWQIAKTDAVDMTETFPDIRETTLTVTQGIGNDHQIYAVWQTSAPISFQEQMTQFPYSILWSFFIGLLAGLSSRIIYDKLHGRKRSVTANDTTHNEPSDMTKRKKGSMLFGGLRWSYVFLISLSLFLTALSLVFAIVYRIEWLDAYASDIATGIIGSLIIIFFVDKIIQRNRDKERLQIVKTALQRLRIPLMWQMMLLKNIFKASASSKPSPLPTTYEAVFSDDYYTEIGYLDFSKEAPVATKMDWFSYMDSETRLFKQKLEQITDTYAIFLDAELIGILERITESHFLYFLPQASMIPQIDKQQGFKRNYNVLAGMKEIVKEYVSLMLQLLEYYNSRSDLPITLNPDAWRDDVAPRWGSSRLQGS